MIACCRKSVRPVRPPALAVVPGLALIVGGTGRGERVHPDDAGEQGLPTAGPPALASRSYRGSIVAVDRDRRSQGSPQNE